MLILTRKPGESVVIDIGDIDPNTPVGELFAGGPIEISVTLVKEHHVRLGIQADTRFLILRSELTRIIRKPRKYLAG